VRRDTSSALGPQPRVAAHQRDAGNLHRHVGARGHGNAHVGRRQRRGIVDAITDNGHDLTSAAQLLHHGRLVARQHFGAELADAQPQRHRLGAAVHKTGVPRWWPGFCLAFDLTTAVLVG
jgi:hypothetical protein